MTESDTIGLLQECGSGTKMGTASIDDVLYHVRDESLRGFLTDCRKKHDELGSEIQMLLKQYQEEEKEPGPMAKSMAWMKINGKLAMDESDKTIAGLITDGCNMGVKTLNQYLNQYKNADEKAKDIAKRLIGLEEKLAVDLRPFL